MKIILLLANDQYDPMIVISGRRWRACQHASRLVVRRYRGASSVEQTCDGVGEAAGGYSRFPPSPSRLCPVTLTKIVCRTEHRREHGHRLPVDEPAGRRPHYRAGLYYPATPPEMRQFLHQRRRFHPRDDDSESQTYDQVRESMEKSGAEKKKKRERETDDTFISLCPQGVKTAWAVGQRRNCPTRTVTSVASPGSWTLTWRVGSRRKSWTDHCPPLW